MNVYAIVYICASVYMCLYTKCINILCIYNKRW